MNTNGRHDAEVLFFTVGREARAMPPVFLPTLPLQTVRSHALTYPIYPA